MEAMHDRPPPDISPTVRTYPGARRPDRSAWVDAGLRIATYEWGDPDATRTIAIAHGGFDFAGTFDVLAPLLADEGGYRVLSWDARGHGNSEHAALYSWQADLRDAKAVMDTHCPDQPMVLLGHSKGGGLILDLAHALPHRVTQVINLDGLPSKNNWPDLADHERTRMLRGEIEGWLDHRQKVAAASRRPGTLEDLARRRQNMNPRLSQEWLEYLVPIGGEEVFAPSDPTDPARDGQESSVEAADETVSLGWRWKLDAGLRLGGFGPYRPEWSMQRLPGIGVPVLGVLGMQQEVMGWGTTPADVTPNAPPVFRFEAWDDVGHFVHIEQPRRVADLVLEFLEDHR